MLQLVAVADLHELTVPVSLECKDTSHCVCVPCSGNSDTAGVLLVMLVVWDCSNAGILRHCAVAQR